MSETAANVCPPVPEYSTWPDPPTRGRIDVHSHLLPGIDDGCDSLEESLDCVRQLIAAGFVGTICTPHIIPSLFPDNTPANIAAWTQRLQQQIDAAGLAYTLWPGGEVRLSQDTVSALKAMGVPTLANTNRVLTDFWGFNWPGYIESTLKWLISEGYQPIVAHPERIAFRGNLDKKLDRLEKLGCWFQGNFRCFTQHDVENADKLIRRFMNQGRYHMLALDMHDPATLPARFEGLQLAIETYGQSHVDALSIDAPRRLVFQTEPV